MLLLSNKQYHISGIVYKLYNYKISLYAVNPVAVAI